MKLHWVPSSAAFSRKRFRPHAGALLVALLAAVGMTWPLALHAGDHVLRAGFFWDAYTNAMILGSRADALSGAAALSAYDNYFFAPLRDSIVFNENHFGLSLLFAPFYWASGNGLWAYNLTLLASLGLSVFFTYLFVRRLTKSRAAGLFAGVAFAFSPYVLFEIGRIQLVATQWIPACFLFLHRAIEKRRHSPWDSVAFWVFFLLQIGTCLYYAMFLIPLFCLVGVLLILRKRPGRRFYVAFGACAVFAALVAFFMVRPYFKAREAFDLERSFAYASSYDGKLGFFTNVPETNRTLLPLRHRLDVQRAREEIAFPGVAVSFFALVALLAPLARARRLLGEKPVLRLGVRWLALLFFAGLLTLLSHSMLPGFLVFLVGAWRLSRRRGPHPFRGRRGIYFAALLFAVLLFLGLTPLEWNGAPVRGLYYYLYTYFPGFDGIRKVSRQALLTTFAACVLAGFGCARLFGKFRGARQRSIALVLLLGFTTWELRAFPHPLEAVWSDPEASEVLRFVAALPPADLVASAPQNTGMRVFRGDAGLALHNLLALQHKHRFVNGQSSWQPPVTELARRALRELPADSARRALLAIGTDHLILFSEDLEPRMLGLAAKLRAEPEHYRSIFHKGPHSVFTLLGREDPTLALLETPALPAAARRVPPSLLSATASLQERSASLALDGNPQSYWTGRRPQARGQTFELTLAEPQRLLALEIENPGRVMDVPNSFALRVSNGGEPFKTILERPLLQLYREQIHSPKTFVFRLVFPEPVLADRVRLNVEQPMPEQYFSIHELRLYRE